MGNDLYHWSMLQNVKFVEAINKKRKQNITIQFPEYKLVPL